jgi:hypothetical protein
MATGTTSGGSGSIANDAGLIAASVLAVGLTVALGAPLGIGLLIGGVAITIGFLAAATIAKGDELSPDMVVSDLDLSNCFPPGTLTNQAGLVVDRRSLVSADAIA